MAKRYAQVTFVALIWLVLDQLTKAAITAGIPLGQGIPVINGCFNIVHVLNRGAAFGFLNNNTSWQFWLFLGAAVAVVCVIIHIVRTSAPSSMLFFGLGSILGGAAGNLVDRVRFRAVTDFIDVYLGAWHWPAFNVADMAICLGVAAAGFVLLRQSPEKGGN